MMRKRSSGAENGWFRWIVLLTFPAIAVFGALPGVPASGAVPTDRDLDNNTLSQTVVAPDLVLATVYATDAGPDTRLLTARVANIGTLPTGWFRVAMNVGSPTGELIASPVMSPLNPGVSSDVLVYWDISAGIWLNSLRYTCTYDGGGNLLTALVELWYTSSGIWYNFRRYTHTYDGSENLIHFTSEAWSGSDWYAADGGCVFVNNGYHYSFSCEELSAYYSPITNIENSDNNVLYSFTLSQNFPNPFNPVTKIHYELPRASDAILKIYDILGREIQTLINKHQEPGRYTVEFDAKDLASGIYFYKLQAGSKFLDTKKMLLLQ